MSAPERKKTNVTVRKESLAAAVAPNEGHQTKLTRHTWIGAGEQSLQR